MDDRPWLKHYDKGVAHSLDYPPVPLQHFLEENARLYPDNPCTIFKAKRITYKEMNDLCDRLAAGLADLCVRKGDRVGIMLPNTPQFVLAFFAILKLGAIVVAINPLYKEREILHQVNDAGIEVMIVMSNCYKLLKQAQPKTNLRTLVVTNIKEALPSVTRLLFSLTMEKKGGFRVQLTQGDHWMQDLIASHRPEECPKVEVGPEDMALFQYSGGTTGISKGAIALHRNLVANTLMIHNWMVNCQDGKEIVLMAIPLFHVYGMVCGMCFAIRAADALVMIPDARDTRDVLKNIKKYHPTFYPGVPTMYNALNNDPDVLAGKVDLHSIKACISGSAPLMMETKQKFEALTGGKLVEGFGMSETPTASHCNPLFGRNPPGSIGIPMQDMDARIISLEDEETVLLPGEVGELMVKGPIVMKGYHNMPTETQNTLRDGWLYTGDIARMDEEGYFYIVDRKKELIKPGGYQVWPREVEEVIIQHPKVMEVGVAGVPDAYRGETVKAWVVVKPGETVTEEEIRQWCTERMAKFKVPTEVEFRDELPKTMVGKILRRELVRQHKEREAA